jgi:hypothetical protein
MGKIKELIGQGWSRWCMRVALVVAIVGFVLLCKDASGLKEMETPYADEPMRAPIHETEKLILALDAGNVVLGTQNYQALNFLLCLKLIVDYTPQYVIAPAAFICFLGTSLDAGTNWLRKRRAAEHR